MAEWSIAIVLKTIGQQCPMGSNPILSSRIFKQRLRAFSLVGQKQAAHNRWSVGSNPTGPTILNSVTP